VVIFAQLVPAVPDIGKFNNKFLSHFSPEPPLGIHGIEALANKLRRSVSPLWYNFAKTACKFRTPDIPPKKLSIQ
jgi:hypothetical protein